MEALDGDDDEAMSGGHIIDAPMELFDRCRSATVRDVTGPSGARSSGRRQRRGAGLPDESPR
jgi:hypothetical protein